MRCRLQMFEATSAVRLIGAEAMEALTMQDACYGCAGYWNAWPSQSEPLKRIDFEGIAHGHSHP